MSEEQQIGLSIKKMLHEEGRSVEWLAKKIGCKRRNVYDIFTQQLNSMYEIEVRKSDELLFGFRPFENQKLLVRFYHLPIGYAEVKQLRDTNSDQGTRYFSVMIYLQIFTDIVKIQTDKYGKMLSFHSETNQLTIKIQP